MELNWDEKQKKRLLYEEKLDWELVEFDIKFEEPKLKKEAEVKVYERKAFSRRGNSRQYNRRENISKPEQYWLS